MRTATTQKSTSVRTAMQRAMVRTSFRVGGALAPAATARRAARLFGTPSPQARLRALQVADGGAARSTLEVAGERLAVYQWGNPAWQPYVLLSHGWSSYGLRFLAWIAPLRAAGYAVVAFDQVGHGGSSGDRSNLPQFAHNLHAMVARFGAPQAIIGHSMGGAAAAIALAEGLPTQRALLIAPAADLSAALRRFNRTVGVPAFLRRRVSRAVEDAANVRFDSLLMHPQVPRIVQPALIVHDLDDADVPWDEGERYARYWPAARMLSTEGLGHHRILTDPDVIATGLRFLAGEDVGQRVVSTPNLPYGIA